VTAPASAFVVGNNSKTAGTTLTLTVPSAISGKDIFICVGYDNLTATTPTVAASGGTGYTWSVVADSDSVSASSGGAVRCTILRGTGGSMSASGVVTLTFSGSITAKAASLFTVDATTPLTVVTTGVANGTGTACATTANGSAVVDDVVIVAGALEGTQTFSLNFGGTATQTSAVSGQDNRTTGGSAATNAASYGAINNVTGSGTVGTSLTLSSSTDWSAAHALIRVSGPTTVNATAAFNGGGTLTASAFLALFTAAVLNGGGTLAATAFRQQAATAAFNGSGTLTASGVPTKVATAAFNGGGTLTASGVREVQATASFSGGGTLTASSFLQQAATAAFAGGGTLTATAFRQQAASAAFAGGGTFTAAYITSVSATAALTGGGTLTASGVREVPGTAALTGGGTLTAAAVRAVPATAALAGGGTLTASGVRAVTASASFTGGGTLAALSALSATATFGGGGTLVALASIVGGYLRIVAAYLPPPFDQLRYIAGLSSARRGARLGRHFAVPTQRALLINAPSATHPLGTVRAATHVGLGSGWDADSVIQYPQEFVTSSDDWRVQVLINNGYPMETVT
jgi:hypothetical protein